MSFKNKLMKNSGRLLFAAGLGLLLTACSDDNIVIDAPLVADVEEALQPQLLVEPEEIVAPPISPAEAASQLGGGFNAAFNALPTDTPLDPVPGDIINIDPTADPIDITDPN